jgi:hypothetical protein
MALGRVEKPRARPRFLGGAEGTDLKPSSDLWPA